MFNFFVSQLFILFVQSFARFTFPVKGLSHVVSKPVSIDSDDKGTTVNEKLALNLLTLLLFHSFVELLNLNASITLSLKHLSPHGPFLDSWVELMTRALIRENKIIFNICFQFRVNEINVQCLFFFCGNKRLSYEIVLMDLLWTYYQQFFGFRWLMVWTVYFSILSYWDTAKQEMEKYGEETQAIYV